MEGTSGGRSLKEKICVIRVPATSKGERMQMSDDRADGDGEGLSERGGCVMARWIVRDSGRAPKVIVEREESVGTADRREEKGRKGATDGKARMERSTVRGSSKQSLVREREGAMSTEAKTSKLPFQVIL